MTHSYRFDNRSQRGVTLMMVLALMTMFAMLAVTFMIVTTQFQRTSEAIAQILLQDINGTASAALDQSMPRTALQKLLDGGFDNGNVIGPHGILENLYGHPNFYDVPSSTSYDKNLEVLVTDIDGTLADNTIHIKSITADGGGMEGPLDLVGSVVTVSKIPTTPPPTPLQQSLLGKSTSILKSNYDRTTTPAGAEFLIARFPGIDRNLNNLFQEATALNGCRLVINPPAFSGTGPGFDPGKNIAQAALTYTDNDFDSTGALGSDNANAQVMKMILRPNVFAPDDDGQQRYKLYFENNLVMMNPDYTAPDYANMFLGWYDVDHATSPPQLQNIIPSFHRPQLIRYWDDATTIDEDILRRIVLRPMPYDHPDFTGSNSFLDWNEATLTGNFNLLKERLIEGPWDVDNDGDGIPDGIWLDVGFGVINDSVTGENYKPLVSFLVLDMDGRLNLNTHGNIDQTIGNYDPPYTSDPLTAKEYGGLEVRGSGTGPADVRLDTIPFGVNLDKLLEGDSGKQLYGRYGDTISTADPGDPTSSADNAALGKYILDNMGVNANAYGHVATGFGVGGLAPDFWGSTALAFDPLGNRYQRQFTPSPNIFALNPYLANPYGSVDDNVFTLDELQLMLRSPGDVDYTALPDRLRALLDDNVNSPSGPYPFRIDPAKWSELRFDVTTRSSDIPSMSLFGGGTSAGTLQSFYAKLLQITGGNTVDADALLDLLPAEIRRGEKVNLNRLTQHPYWTDYTNSANYEKMLCEKAKFAQEIFYLLMVLCHDEMKTYTTEGELKAANGDIVRRLAQWSVNLVDFLDADSAMTPFIFSTDPLTDRYDNDSDNATGSPSDPSDIEYLVAGNGWSPRSNLELIWGMEKPEIAMTETLAVHNRRVADTCHLETTPAPIACSTCSRDPQLCTKSPCTTPGAHDEYFDQVLPPEGSLFIELYRQGNPNRADYPAGFGIAADGKFNLAQMSGSDPVWRIVIGQRTPTTPFDGEWKKGTDDALDQSQTDPLYKFDDYSTGTTNIVPERFIWFTTTSGTGGGLSYVRNTGLGLGDEPKLLPNEYLVIGPRELTAFRSKPGDPAKPLTGNTFGQPYYDAAGEPNVGDYAGGATDQQYLDDMDAFNDTKKTRIDLATDLPSNAIYMIATKTTTSTDSAGVNVSEPIAGYGTPPIVKPWDTDDLLGFGTIPCYKTILLQRLADPIRPYHAISNPYITVDWNMADLHVINSETSKTGPAPIDPVQVADEEFDDDAIPTADLLFSARQWGKTGITAGLGPKRPNLWPRLVDSSSATAGLDATLGPGDQKNCEVEHTLGSLNEYVLEAGPVGKHTPTIAAHFGDYKDTPDPAFLHFPWNDAPLTNTLELMMVPACSVDRLGLEFFDKETATDVYASSSSLGCDASSRFGNPESNIGPYLNFFSGDNVSPATSLNLARLFEYVRVPSRFVGTIRDWTTATGSTPPQAIYEMREPGKINLNTVTEGTWETLIDDDHNRYKDYDTLRAVREGTHLGTATPALPVPPTEFAAPFRSPSGANLVPLNEMVRNPSDTTLLRQDENAATTEPFIKPNDFITGSNPYTMLENVMRLSDVTTCRSNVFAVWVTVGYFKVEKFDKADLGTGTNDLFVKYPNLSTTINVDNFGAIYPGGYVLGEEKGLNDGTVRRERGFFLIDRSVPVGFRRGGKDSAGNTLNTSDVIIYSKTLD